MPFRGVTFSGQNVTPKNDGGLYQAHYGDGILWGCSMSLSGDDLVIQSGEFIMGGRVVQVDGATSVDLSGRTLQTGYIQVIMNADLSQGEGSQWYTTFVESATTTFPALTQGNINDTDTLYQLELAVIQISGGNLTSIYSSAGVSILRTGSQFIGSTDGLDNDLFLIGNGNNIGVRPNGDTTNQVYWDTNGQQNGGHKSFVHRAGTGTFTGDSWSLIWDETIEKGTWILAGHIAFSCTSTTTGVCGIVRSTMGQSDSAIGRQTTYAYGTNYWVGVSCSAIITPTDFGGDSTMTFKLAYWLSQNCTREGMSFTGIRIG